MKYKIFKKAIFFVLAMLLNGAVSAQPTEKQYSEPKKLSRDIQKEVSDAIKKVGIELNNIDFEELGHAIASAGRDISRELGRIEVHALPQPPEPADYSGLAEKTKLISKSYAVDRNDKLSIDNLYGKVAVHTWTKNEIKISIEIKAYESSESSAAQLLESVNINESRNGDLISYKTSFEKTSVNFWSKIRNGKEERRGVQVNYEIFMPAKNPLDITNRYGSTEIDDFNGPVNISSSYGSFSSGSLDNAANQVKITYGSASINNFSKGKLSVSYGSLKLDKGEDLTANIRYSSARISQLSGSGTFDIAYTGGFKIDEVERNVRNLVINSSYSGLTLGIKQGADFDFDVTVSYAGFNFDDERVNLINKVADSSKPRSWSPTKNYKGSIGKGSDSRIIIKSNYGSVKFL